MRVLFWSGTNVRQSRFARLLLRIAVWWDGAPWVNPHPPTNFWEYHQAIAHLANYPCAGSNLIYPALGLVGEAGELSEKIKKMWRDHGIISWRQRYYAPDADKMALRLAALKEAGDVLWYLDAICVELESNLEEVARLNVEKLLSRERRQTLHGSGDNR